MTPDHLPKVEPSTYVPTPREQRRKSTVDAVLDTIEAALAASEAGA